VKHKANDFPPDQIDSDEAIDLVIDAVLIRSKPLRTMTKKVLRAQRRLRRAVDEDGWDAYLRLEQIVNERTSAEMDLLLRWGLMHGSRTLR
jgi:hypothetical protein